MKIETFNQGSPEWFDARKGRIGGTRFSNVISTKKNRLIYDLLDERFSEFLFPDDFISDEMQFGIDNEPIARQLYSEQSGIKFKEVGLIRSDFSSIHHTSPDGLSFDESIALEIKCTQNRAIHMQRFFEGVESTHMPQIKNYFAVSDEILQVHWVSYCPFATERPLIVIVFRREEFAIEIPKWRFKIQTIEATLNEFAEKWRF